MTLLYFIMRFRAAAGLKDSRGAWRSHRTQPVGVGFLCLLKKIERHEQNPSARGALRRDEPTSGRKGDTDGPQT